MARLILPIRTDSQDIETIIHSFEKFALGDIIYTQPMPIAVFILSICFINQLATFLYPIKADKNKKPEWFIRDYMKEYDGIDLYDKARHTLVHNYSSRDQFNIDKVGYENVPYEIKGGVIFINTNVFVCYLHKAFNKAAIDMRNTGSEQYKNALENSKYYPVLVDVR